MTVVNCPQCREQVTVPAGTSAQALVRCPLCRDEFPLARILTQLPPVLIVVRDAPEAADESRRETGTADAWSSVTEAEPQEEYALRPANPAAEHDASPFPFASNSAAPTATRTNGKTHARTRSANPLRQIFQVAFGGVVGVGLAQVVLWWIPVDLSLDTRDLTGLGRKYGHYAPFLVPASVREPAVAGGVLRSTAAVLADQLGPEPSSAPGIANANQPTADDAKPELAAASLDAERPAQPPEAAAVSTETLEPAPPTVPAGEVAVRFDEAQAATAALAAASSPDAAERRKLVKDFYGSLAGLGEALAWCDPSADGVRESSLDASNLLARVAEQAERVALIETVTPSWLDNPRPHHGVCLVGSVESLAPCGEMFEMRLRLRDGRALTLLSRRDPTGQLPPDSRILVLGAIVESPARKIAGCATDAAQAVLVGSHVRL